MAITTAPADPAAVRARLSRRHVRRLLVVLALVAVVGWSVRGVDLSVSGLLEERRGVELLVQGLFSPDLTAAWLQVALAATVETVQIAVVGLLLAGLGAAPLALLLAANTQAPAPLREAARLVAAVQRGVPDLLWALLLVSALGPGPAAGALALGVHGAGALAKLWAEQLEAVDPDPVEAMSLMGAGRVATAALATVPLARGGLVSLLLFQGECNIRASAVLGFVGAGGIGQELAISLKLFRYEQLSTLVLAVLALMLVTDLLSRWWRRRLGARA